MRSRNIILLLTMFLGSCAPVTATRCSPGLDRGRLEAQATLTNHTSKVVSSVQVLVNADRARTGLGNRLFAFATELRPGETRNVDGRSVDAVRYDFKDSGAASRGCELEFVQFSDGTNWIHGSPM